MKRLVTCFLLLAVPIFFISCSGNSTGPNTNSKVDAVVSYQPQAPGIGETVTLDASGSSDSEGKSLSYEWSLTVPGGSSASLSEKIAVNPTFIPDVEGEYTASLKASNDDGQSDQASVTFTVTTSGQKYVELSGSIDADKTLKDIFEDPAKKDYLVTGDIALNATLTVDPGVVVHFEEDALLSVNQNGTIIAEGTASDSIKFTSSNSAAGLLWQGIFVKSSTSLNLMKYVEVSYAGNSKMDFAYDDYKAAMGIREGGKISIENSHIHHTAGYGVYADDDGGILGTFASNKLESNITGVGAPANTISSIEGNNQFAGNQEAAVEVLSSTLDANKQETWNAFADGAAYYVSGDLSVDGVLTVAPGAVFEMAEDVLWTVNGALIADGTSSEKIQFTSANVTGGLYWQGIHIKSADSRNSFSYAELMYGGNSAMDFSYTDYAAIVGVHASGKVSVTNSTIKESKGYGLYVDDDGGQIEEFASNSFSNTIRAIGLPADEVDEMDSNTNFSNNTQAEVEISKTIFNSTKTATWLPLSGDAYYRVSGNLVIDGELTINAGAKFELDQDVQVVVNGAMMANGENGNKVIFTSSNIPGNLHWKGLFIRSADSRNVLNYVDVWYAGNSALEFAGTNYSANIGVNENAQLTITNSDISYSGGYGVYSKGVVNDFESAGANNTFSGNVSGNVVE